MNGGLKAKLKNKEYRDAYIAETLKTALAAQIMAMRAKRGWTQAELARRVGTTQNVISRLEDPDYGKFNLQTLLDIAAAFDVALLAKFVSIERLVDEFEDVSPDALAVASYPEELAAAAGITSVTVSTDSNAKDTYTFAISSRENVAANYEEAAAYAAAA